MNYYFSEASDQPTCSKNFSSNTRQKNYNIAGRTGCLRSIFITNRSLFFDASKDEMLELLSRLKNVIQKEIPMLELEQHWTNIVRDSVSLREIRT
ncbi:unnamed protein product [Onchocerca flexuosa]|uniref:Uncharacterized protein n=1 Tax=Onchocerca flexuosa TaxID=387005 RepID=A0A183HSJ5_9BILA|nr:unnamed protein product [Onchocerca flexuosa]